MKRGIIFLISLIWVGCNQSPEKASTQPVVQQNSNVLASFDGGEVTKDDFERAVLAMPRSLRPESGDLPLEVRTKLLKKIALDRILLTQASSREVAAEQGFQIMERQLKRVVFSQHYLQQHAPAVTITEAGLEAYFDEFSGQYHLPERRHVLHIFRRNLESEASQTKALLETVREKMIQGVDWATLAETYSHSESRHEGGDLGMIHKGQFSKDFDDIVFSLPKGIPSDPIATGDGYHLFYIQSSIAAFEPELSEIRPQVLSDFQKHLLAETRRELAEALPLPEPSQKVSPETLMQYMSMGEPSLTLFEMGSYRFLVSDFLQWFSEVHQGVLSEQSLGSLAKVLDEVWDQERIFQFLVRENRIDEHHPQYLQMRQQKLADYLLEKRLREQVLGDESALQVFFANNKMRFATPLKMKIGRLVVPIGEKPTQQMAAMEVQRKAYLAGEIDATAMAQHLGGKIQSLPMSSSFQLQKFDPRLPVFAAGLEPGGVSPPYRYQMNLIMLLMEGRQLPQPQPFEKMKSMVAAEYLSQHLQQVFDAFSDTMLDQHHFKLHP